MHIFTLTFDLALAIVLVYAGYHTFKDLAAPCDLPEFTDVC